MCGATFDIRIASCVQPRVQVVKKAPKAIAEDAGEGTDEAGLAHAPAGEGKDGDAMSTEKDARMFSGVVPGGCVRPNTNLLNYTSDIKPQTFAHNCRSV